MTSSKAQEEQVTNDRLEDNSHESETFLHRVQAYSRTSFIVPSTSRATVDKNHMLCGIGSWHPQCLQRFANSSAYLVIFCVSMMFLGMPNSYFYAISSTIEKVFHMNSKVTGVILIGNDVSQVLFSIAIGYVGSKGSRPLWMAVGLVFVSASCFIYASCHYFWDGLAAAATLSDDTKLDLVSNFNQSRMASEAKDLCWVGNQTFPSDYLTRTAGSNECPAEKPVDYLPAALFFFGQFMAGIGNTALISLGISYGDDYTSKKNAPILIAFMIMSRMVGAFTGFMFAGICLSIYVIPGVNPNISQRDPRWLGAWWLGFLVFGCCIFVSALLMLLVPKKLPPKIYRRVSTIEVQKTLKEPEEEGEPHLTKIAVKDLIQTLLRLLRNPILVLSLLTESFFLLYTGASSIYASRYTEVQFRQSASKASILTGVFSICIMMVATIAGSLLFSKYKPKATWVTGTSTILRCVQCVLILGQMMLSCGKVNYANVSIGNNRFDVTSNCSRSCDCLGAFEPVCIGNVTFLSPCLAGCSGYYQNGTQKRFYDCSCASHGSLMESENFDHQSYDGSSRFPTAKPGICASETCSTLSYYLALSAIINIMSAVLYPANAVIILRSVDKADKSMAMALKMVGFCLIGFFPGPIIYGTVFDSACILRESEQCTGGKGNCWVYDVDKLRWRFLGTSAMVIAISFAFSILLYHKVRQRTIVLFDDDDNAKGDDDTKNTINANSKEMKPMNQY